MKQKKKWVRPILTVLIRGEDRQERVLSVCKDITVAQGGSVDQVGNWGMCMGTWTLPSCVHCMDWNGS